MVSEVSQEGCFSRFINAVVQKQWIATALLVSSVVLFGGLTTLGGLNVFNPKIFPATLTQSLGNMGKVGGMAALIGGGTLTVSGIGISTVLFINQGRSPLHRAIVNQDERARKKILDTRDTEEGDVNEADYSGNRPLHYAAMYDFGLENLLWFDKLDLNAENNNKETPLMVAVKAGKVSSVIKLLEQVDVRVDARTIECAIANGNIEIVNALIHSNKYAGPWQELLLLAIDKANVEVVNAILAIHDHDIQDLNDAFVHAAGWHLKQGEAILKILHIFMDKGVGINAKSRVGGRTALHEAARQNNRELVSKLLQNPEIDVNIKDHLNESALELAMEGPWIELSIDIIETGKVLDEILRTVKIMASYRTQTSRTDCGAVILAINKVMKDPI